MAVGRRNIKILQMTSNIARALDSLAVLKRPHKTPTSQYTQ